MGLKQMLNLMAGGLFIVWLTETIRSGDSQETISLLMTVSIVFRLLVALFEASEEYTQRHIVKYKDSE